MDVDLVADPIGADPNGSPVVSARALAVGSRGGRGRRICAGPFDVRGGLRDDPRRHRELAGAPGADRRPVRLGPGVDLHQPPHHSSKASPRRRPRCTTSPTRACSHCSATASTTDHISPAGAIRRDGPAGKWLLEHGVPYGEFNSYGSRRGNHEVMVRGTFANIRLRKPARAGTEGGVTVASSGEHADDDLRRRNAVRDRRRPARRPRVARSTAPVLSARLAAKGSKLLGIRAVLVESFERIHRSNLVGMGVASAWSSSTAQTVAALGLTGSRDPTGSSAWSHLRNRVRCPRQVTVERRRQTVSRFGARIDYAVRARGGSSRAASCPSRCAGSRGRRSPELNDQPARSTAAADLSSTERYAASTRACAVKASENVGEAACSSRTDRTKARAAG